VGGVTEQVLGGVLGVRTCGDLLTQRGPVAELFQPSSQAFLLTAGESVLWFMHMRRKP
jgi:hypothetical protein